MTTNTTHATSPPTRVVPAGGFIGDPAEAFNPPATDSSCCGSDALTDATAEAGGGCCGSAADSTGGCCG